MKNDLLRRIEAKYAAHYAALYQAKMRMTLQLAQDAAMIAANEVLQMGPGRAPDFASKMREVVNEIADVMLVTPQTAYNLQRLADMDKTSPGRVVDKLVRDRMIELRRHSDG